MLSLQKKNSITSGLFLWVFCITPVYVGTTLGLLPWTILALHFFLVIACWAKQAFAQVLGNLAMYNSIFLQAVSCIAVTWPGLPTSLGIPRLLGAWSSYSSGESSFTTLDRLQLAWLARLDLVTIRGWEKFILSDQCDSLSKSRGTSAFRFWKLNTSLPAMWGAWV